MTGCFLASTGFMVMCTLIAVSLGGGQETIEITKIALWSILFSIAFGLMFMLTEYKRRK